MQKTNKHERSLRSTFFHVGPSVQQALCCCLGTVAYSIQLSKAGPIRQVFHANTVTHSVYHSSKPQRAFQINFTFTK